MYKKIFILTLLLILYSSIGHGETYELTPEKRADIIELLKITEVGTMVLQLGNELSSDILDSLIKVSGRKVPERAIKITKEEMEKAWEQVIKSEKFYDLIVPVYNKYYSHKEIKALVDFYKTDLGRKTISVTPNINQEGMMVGQKLGAVIVEIALKRITERFKEEGIDLKD